MFQGGGDLVQGIRCLQKWWKSWITEVKEDHCYLLASPLAAKDTTSAPSVRNCRTSPPVVTAACSTHKRTSRSYNQTLDVLKPTHLQTAAHTYASFPPSRSHTGLLMVESKMELLTGLLSPCQSLCSGERIQRGRNGAERHKFLAHQLEVRR